jgi:ketosteroid isomerase-like protein
MSEQSNLEIVRQVYAAFGRGDLPALFNLLAEDVDWRMAGPAPYAGRRKGHAAVQEFFAKLMEAADIQHFAAAEFLAAGDTVVVLGDERIRARATGRVMTQDWAHVYKVRGDKITAVSLIEDTAGHAAIYDSSPETLRAQLAAMG